MSRQPEGDRQQIINDAAVIKWRWGGGGVLVLAEVAWAPPPGGGRIKAALGVLPLNECSSLTVSLLMAVCVYV